MHSPSDDNNTEINRWPNREERFNEILASLKHEYPNDRKLDYILEEQGHEGLLRSDYIRRVSDIKFPWRSRKTKPGMMHFKIPNKLRYTAESFGLESFSANNTIPFEDPYPDFAEFSLDDALPPTFTTNLDGDIQQHTFEDGYDQRGPDILGTYLSGWDNSLWGIFLNTQEIFAAAKKFFPYMDPYQAWMTVFRTILYHEYFHFLSEYHCRRITLTTPSNSRYLAYEQALNDALNDEPDLVVEEAVANAYAYHRMENHVDFSTLSDIESMFLSADVPYKNFTKYYKTSSRQNHGLSIVAYQQNEKYSPIPKRSHLNQESASIFTAPVTRRVPVFLVLNGGIKPLNEAGVFTIYPTLRPTSNMELSEFETEVNSLISDLNGGNLTKLSKLISTRDEKLMYLKCGKKMGHNIALFTQVRDTEGISMVYFGSEEGCEWIHYHDRN